MKRRIFLIIAFKALAYRYVTFGMVKISGVTRCRNLNVVN